MMLRSKPICAFIILTIAMTVLACCIAPPHDAVPVGPGHSVAVWSGVLRQVVGAVQRGPGDVLLLAVAPLAIGLWRLSSRRCPRGNADNGRSTPLVSRPLRI